MAERRSKQPFESGGPWQSILDGSAGFIPLGPSIAVVGAPASNDRLLRSREVQERTGLSRTTLWRLERQGKFPKRAQLSPNVVAWRESEVAAWIAQQRGRPAGA